MSIDFHFSYAAANGTYKCTKPTDCDQMSEERFVASVRKPVNKNHTIRFWNSQEMKSDYVIMSNSDASKIPYASSVVFTRFRLEKDGYQTTGNITTNVMAKRPVFDPISGLLDSKRKAVYFQNGTSLPSGTWIADITVTL